MPVNLETFNRILKLTLSVNSKQYVLDSIKKLEELDYIKSAEPNYVIEMENLGSPNDSYYNNPLEGVSSQWAYDSMNMEEAWEYVDAIDVKENILVGVYVTGGKLNAESAVKNIHRHSNLEYVFDTSIYHRAECSCGTIILEPHVWLNNPMGGKSCIKCGWMTLSVNYIIKKEEEVY